MSDEAFEIDAEFAAIADGYPPQTAADLDGFKSAQVIDALFHSFTQRGTGDDKGVKMNHKSAIRWHELDHPFGQIRRQRLVESENPGIGCKINLVPKFDR